MIVLMIDSRQSTVARVGVPGRKPGAASVSSGSLRSNPWWCHRSSREKTVVYSRLQSIEHSPPAATPVAVIANATTGRQQEITGTATTSTRRRLSSL
ncbi:MAG: hypothetical protein HYX64_03700 [Gammaproteobacteria bacterium]|nr:hypothetical protein [Gammaproteobacteria bacterium]